MPAPLNANELRLLTVHAPLRERMPLTLAVACANVYGGCISMAMECFYGVYGVFSHRGSFRYITKGAESEQPVGAPFYQWVGCRDDAGLVCFPHSGSW